ncbi:unnamed protein product [Protopolystoma xenopodis]|uniref:Uncharacterized protein n=1 Tax=Protopolystoma xenopodis TaxID=117903 RepID=A0A3S5CUQ2_9PLAT|nr:unnamed protein product [Protopolystoma xenopodis]
MRTVLIKLQQVGEQPIASKKGCDLFACIFEPAKHKRLATIGVTPSCRANYTRILVLTCSHACWQWVLSVKTLTEGAYRNSSRPVRWWPSLSRDPSMRCCQPRVS